MNSTGQPEPHLHAVAVEKTASSIRWDTGAVLVVAADRSVRSVLHRVKQSVSADWVVVVRSRVGGLDYYAYRCGELEQLAADLLGSLDAQLQDALDLRGWTPSSYTRGRRPPVAWDSRQGNPATSRVIDLDAAGCVAAIGEYHATTDFMLDDLFGTFRSLRNEPASAPDERVGGDAAASTGIGVTISAETKSELEIGVHQRVDFRVEISSEAVPLAVSREAVVRPDRPIAVLLSLENDVLEVISTREIVGPPPASGRPFAGNFVVKGIKAGVLRLTVTFRQGGSELGVIALAVQVVANSSNGASTKGSANAMPPDPADDNKLALIIEQCIKGGEVFYRYILHSEELNLQYEAFNSRPLLDRGGGPAATALAFVERIYARVTQELKSFDDIQQLQREARALGAGLSRELFDPDVARRLWPLREHIKLIQIRSWEPYIPWELVRLHDPDTQDTDDRFLAEYNLVRTLTDRVPPRRLPMAKWSCLAATFPLGSLPAVGAELEYFTREMTPSLQEHGIKADHIDPARDAVYDALAEGEFDVLHISCHAESSHVSIEDSTLVIGDTSLPGASKPTLIQVSSATVAGEAKLMRRRPLVFLNACETGRVGAVLTAWGGWPNIFIRAGAGAFVGTAWAVRDKPAAAFSTAFYEALWNGKTLAEAAGEARATARAFGDASWLAFKVYGHPRARRGAL